MSHKINDNIKEYLQEVINENLEIATFIRDKAQQSLDNDDLETAIEILEEGNRKNTELLNEEIKDL